MNIFVVDDSAIFRKAIGAALEPTEFKVVGSANDGQMALKVLQGLSDVDIIIADMEMPVMNGLEFINAYRMIDRNTKILVFSSITERGAKITIDALLAGANDFLTKSNDKSESGGDPVKALREKIVPKLRQFKSVAKDLGQVKKKEPVKIPMITKRSLITTPPKVICIGSSTGGPDALKAVLSQISPNMKIPILIAQHMPAMFTAELAKLLNKTCPLEVKEAEEGEVAQGGVVYIAPGDFHMRVKMINDKPVLKMDQGPKVNFVRPAVDLLFESVGQVYGSKCLAVILTGMGQDGLEGVKCLKTHGDDVPVVIQDQQSCVVFGMPGAIYEANLYDEILPLDKIAEHINGSVNSALNIKERPAI